MVLGAHTSGRAREPGNVFFSRASSPRVASRGGHRGGSGGGHLGANLVQSLPRSPTASRRHARPTSRTLIRNCSAPELRHSAILAFTVSRSNVFGKTPP